MSREPATEGGDPNPKNGPTVLVVDDQLSLLELLEQILVRYGFGVVTACSPQSALEGWPECQEKIDVIVTDVIMPGLSGIHLAEQFLQGKPGLKVVYMSGYSLESLENLGHRIPRNCRFLQKPFKPQDLVAALSGASREVQVP